MRATRSFVCRCVYLTARCSDVMDAGQLLLQPLQPTEIRVAVTTQHESFAEVCCLSGRSVC